MTTGTIIWLLAIGAIFYLMAKNGGGCCGGHGHNNEHSSHGGNHDDSRAETGDGDYRTGRQ